jgi:peptidoglycan/xylan/chitin deacetylase (PgdA/CDA1 family)
VRTVLALAAVVLGLWLTTQTDEVPLLWLLRLSVVVIVAVSLPLAAVRRRWAANLLTTAEVVVVVTGLWIGSNSPQLTWFGHQVSHGPRDRNQVALTFDDGPNDSATLQIAAILDARHAKGTFFEVGKAVNQRPEITRALLADGHLVGNHSYHHDSTHWLDPRYLELEKAQKALERVGACPAFFRAPHGQHTPFMAHVVQDHGMTMVGWDVSAGDWSSHDPQDLARRILAQVRPGSIIDLHDGLDGRVTVDRRVLVEAMPLILDGLAARHLEAVRLDVLLGRPGYLAGCT